MRRLPLGFLSALVVLSLSPALAAPSPPAPRPGAGLPLVAGKPSLATVDGVPITFEEFYRQLGMLHEGAAEGAKVSRRNPMEVLDRMINARLIVREARRIGLDALPEVLKGLQENRDQTLRNLLLARQVQPVKEGDPKLAARFYEEAMREFRISSVLFEKEEGAKAFEAEVKAGGNYSEIAKKQVAVKTAKGGGEPQWVKTVDLVPPVLDALMAMKPGSVSAPIRVGPAFSIVWLAETRLPEEPEARRQAAARALEAKRAETVREYIRKLREQYVKVDRKVFDSIDFESPKPGFAIYAADGRVLAEIRGEKPLTVKEYAETLKGKFFHGIERAISEKKVNARKQEILDGILNKRVVLKEARRLGIERTAEFKARAADFEEGALFGVFQQKLIDPTLKYEQADLERYYKEHASEYLLPEKKRIDVLAFKRRPDAEAALTRLRKGSDFRWVKENSEGQASPGEVDEILAISGRLLATDAIPERARKAVEGAAPGDVRLVGSGEGPFHVLVLRDIAPPRSQPFEQVRGPVADALMAAKSKQALAEWTKKLREASDVKLLVTRETLERTLGMDSATSK